MITRARARVVAAEKRFDVPGVGGEQRVVALGDHGVDHGCQTQAWPSWGEKIRATP